MMQPVFRVTILFILLAFAVQAQQISVFPPQIHQQITPESSVTRPLKVYNTGTESLDFTCRWEPWGFLRDTTVGWVTAAPMQGQIAPGDSIIIMFSFNSVGLTIQNYLVNFIIESNDPVNSELEVLAMLHVMDLSIFFMPENDSICTGDSTTIRLAVFGGTENYLFEWTSNPPGFHAFEKEPLVGPARDTWYIVTVTDGGWWRTDSVLIKSAPLPGIPAIIGGPTSIDLYGQVQTIYESSPASHALYYHWEIFPLEAGTISGDGSSATVLWDNGFTGVAVITVKAGNDCGLGEPSQNFGVTVYNSAQVPGLIQNQTVFLSPNPCSDRFNLTCHAGQSGIRQMIITDLSGRIIWQRDVMMTQGENRFTVTTSDLATGLYQIRIKGGKAVMFSVIN